MRLGACGAPDSKAYKEKKRRDKLNDSQASFCLTSIRVFMDCLQTHFNVGFCLVSRFRELSSSVIEPGKPPKTDKVVILNDAVNMVIQLREESQRLQESCNKLLENVKELEAEKNEIREEKTKLKAEKEKLEQQLKALNPPPGFLPRLPPFLSHRLSVANWCRLLDTLGFSCGSSYHPLLSILQSSEDHSLRPQLYYTLNISPVFFYFSRLVEKYRFSLRKPQLLRLLE